MFSRARCPAVIDGAARIALLPAAALAVHQLRYLLAYGSAAGMELQRQGHSYLHSVVPWIILVVALVVGGFLRALGRAFSGQTSLSRFSLSFTALWLVCTVALVAIYGCQEFLEGLFATGHPAGLVGIFGFGGWWAIPAAACVGLVLAADLPRCALGPRGGRSALPSRPPAHPSSPPAVAAPAGCLDAQARAACLRLVGTRPPFVRRAHAWPSCRPPRVSSVELSAR